ncbi:MAG TPA: RNA polymerase sigma factor [Polyangiaceae bacterium]|nr:RNA polymerase sigma factor [Polyangiaceae bacterium]
MPRLHEVPDWPESGEHPTAVTAAEGYGSQEIFTLVYRQMRSLAGSRVDFDDLVQTAAEQAIRSLPSFEGRSKISTWTYRVCYLTLLKHERWYRRWLRRFALTERGELPEAQASGAGDDASLEDQERSLRLRAAVARLSPKRRTVVVLHDLEGATIESIASVMKTNPLTVRSRLRDGRKALTRILANDPYFGDAACRLDGEESER